MASSLMETLVEKLQSLPPEQQQEVLDFVDRLPPAAAGRNAIFARIEEAVKQIPTEAWDEVPADGSENLDHYLYGAPKK